MTDTIRAALDWRGLCEELLLRWDVDGCDWKPQHQARWNAAVERARAALAAEPVVEGPTDEEIIREAIKADLVYRPVDEQPYVFSGFVESHSLNQYVLAFARAVLARFGNQPAPPAPGEVAELVAWLHGQDGGIGRRAIYSRIADLLERQVAPVPVAVSERLPGPEDLNDKGECWEWDPTSDAWVLIRPNGLVFRPGPWLPARALPLPAGEGEK